MISDLIQLHFIYRTRRSRTIDSVLGFQLAPRLLHRCVVHLVLWSRWSRIPSAYSFHELRCRSSSSITSEMRPGPALSYHRPRAVVERLVEPHGTSASSSLGRLHGAVHRIGVKEHRNRTDTLSSVGRMFDRAY